MAGYDFLTTWGFAAPVERVFDVLWDAPSYPTWWKGVLEVERLEQGDADGVGSLDRYVWKSKLPYKLEFRSRTVRVERPWLMEGEAFGELALISGEPCGATVVAREALSLYCLDQADFHAAVESNSRGGWRPAR